VLKNFIEIKALTDAVIISKAIISLLEIAIHIDETINNVLLFYFILYFINSSFYSFLFN
jgi:hypothetical protein